MCACELPPPTASAVIVVGKVALPMEVGSSVIIPVAFVFERWMRRKQSLDTRPGLKSENIISQWLDLRKLKVLSDPFYFPNFMFFRHGIEQLDGPCLRRGLGGAR